MWNKLLFIAVILLLATFSKSVNAQNIKAKGPTNQNIDVRCDTNGYLITSPAGGSVAADVRVRDGTTATSLATVTHPNADDINPLSVYGLVTESGNYCLDAGGLWRRVRCGVQASTNCQCISPANNAYFMISATTAANSAANPIYSRLSDGTNPIDATHPLPVSATSAANTQANPFYCAVSKDTTVNSATNPLAERISVDGANYMDASHPLICSATAAANAVTNPIWGRISADGTNAMDATHPLTVSPTAAANAQANPFYCAVSKDTNVNSVTNPIIERISVDGTNYMDASHPLICSATAAANAVTNPMWERISIDGTNAVDATHPIPISATMAANAVTNPLAGRISVDGTNFMDAAHPLICSATAAANAVTNPMWGRISVDGTNAMDATHPIAISATMAANAATNPLYNRISIDGTNPMDSTHPLTISATNAANTSTNPVYVSKTGTATFSPAKTTTAGVAGALVDVLASIEVLGYVNFCVSLKNNDAVNPFTDAAIYQSPDNSSWESLSWTACDTLAHGAICSYCVSGNGYRYIKAQAKADAILTVSSVDAWITGNAN